MVLFITVLCGLLRRSMVLSSVVLFSEVVFVKRKHIYGRIVSEVYNEIFSLTNNKAPGLLSVQHKTHLR